MSALLTLAVWFATIAMAVIVTTVCLWAASELEEPGWWELAPVSGLGVWMLVFGPVLLRSLASVGLVRTVLWGVHGALIALLVSWFTVLIVEENFISLPNGIDAAPKRWPDWFQRGMKYGGDQGE